MNMMESNTHFNDAQIQFEYITEFKEKSELEVEINTAWRRAETDCVQNLLDHSKISDEMNQLIHELAFDLAHTLRERKSGSGKPGIVTRSLTRICTVFSRRHRADVFRLKHCFVFQTWRHVTY